MTTRRTIKQRRKARRERRRWERVMNKVEHSVLPKYATAPALSLPIDADTTAPQFARFYDAESD